MIGAFERMMRRGAVPHRRAKIPSKQRNLTESHTLPMKLKKRHPVEKINDRERRIRANTKMKEERLRPIAGPQPHRKSSLRQEMTGGKRHRWPSERNKRRKRIRNG